MFHHPVRRHSLFLVLRAIFLVLVTCFLAVQGKFVPVRTSDNNSDNKNSNNDNDVDYQPPTVMEQDEYAAAGAGGVSQTRQEQRNTRNKAIKAGWTEHHRLERDLSLSPRSSETTNNDNSDHSLGNMDPKQAARKATQALVQGSQLMQRLQDIFTKATSDACRAKVLQHFGYFVSALGKEEAFPFSPVSPNFRLNNSCPEPVYEDWKNLPEGLHIGHIQNRTYQPPRDQAEYIDDSRNLKLAYLIMAHQNAPSVIRLVEALMDDNNSTASTSFVIHVDGKEASDATFESLNSYAKQNPGVVHVLPHPYRVRVNWGGFSMVNATLQMLQYATGNLRGLNHSPLQFDKAIHLSETHYPLASNSEIRHELAKYPLDANFMNIIMRPQRTMSWNYFVECDDHIHRIFHLPVPTKATAGFELFVGSQWWIISREFAHYLGAAKPGSFVQQFLPYIEHVVVADEHFFGSILRNTEFCLTHVNRNYLYMEFDRWESDIPASQRDSRKCMMKDPNHCGRSPTTLVAKDLPLLELSDNLFARKFESDSIVKDVIDAWREHRELDMQAFLKDPDNSPDPRSRSDFDFEGYGVLIVAKDTVQDPMPLCLGLGNTGNVVRLVPCFYDWVPANLLPGWEVGAVIQEETLPNNRWTLSQCTTSGGRSLERNITTGGMSVISNNINYDTNGTNVTEIFGPLCMLKQMDGLRSGRCFDGETGGYSGAYVYPCMPNNWGQLISFGDGRVAPLGTIYLNIHEHRKKQFKKSNKQEYYRAMCMGVSHTNHPTDTSPQVPQDIIPVPCDFSTTANILEWVFVPYILAPPEDGEILDQSSHDNGIESKVEEHDASAQCS